MSASPGKFAREITDRLALDGWEYAGRTGGDHMRFRHPSTGALMIVSTTPSARNAHARVLAQARRCTRHHQPTRQQENQP